MTLLEFNSQPLAKRSDLIWEWGYFVCSHKGGGINIILYAVNGFFAELRVQVADNKVLDVKGFNLNELTKSDMDLLRQTKPFLLAVIGSEQGAFNPAA